MDDMVKALMEKLNLEETVAKQAVVVVLAQLKEKLPAPIGDRLEDIVEGLDGETIMNLTNIDIDGDGKSDTGSILGALGSLLGGKK